MVVPATSLSSASWVLADIAYLLEQQWSEIEEMWGHTYAKDKEYEELAAKQEEMKSILSE